MRKQYLTAFVVFGILGGLCIFTLPLRNPVEKAPEPETAVEINIDLEQKRIEEEIEERKLYLDRLLEQEMAKKASISPSERSETESMDILSPETEKSDFGENTQDFSFEESSEEISEESSEKSPFVPVPCMMEPELQEWVFEYCYSQAIDPYVIIALCERESCCKSNILGDNGRAFGIMQIQIQWIPEKLSAHGYTAQDMLEARPNIIIGVEILKEYLWTGNGLRWALMAYNGGQNLAGSESTQIYADWILARAEELRRAHNGEA